MKNPLLSICIPVYNRNQHLNNCLNSIRISCLNSSLDFEVCISDNFSEEDPIDIIENYKKYFKIKYNRNSFNKGLGVNILKSVSLAEGKFVWIIGSDDLILPNTFKSLNFYLNKKDIHFYYINSYHLDAKFLDKQKKPLNTHNIPKDLKKFSNYSQDKQCKFYELISPSISFDFMLGMFLSIFRREIWNENLKYINQKDLCNLNIYSTFDNTAPHVKVFSYGFLNKNAYFVSDCLSVNLSGVREWADLYPFVESFRIPDVLKYYRKNGLNLMRYFFCMNFANRKFLINLFKIFFLKKYKGKNYLNFLSDILPKFFYPYVYIAFLYYSLRKIFKLVL